MRKPYYLKSRQAWFVKTPDGKSQVYLGDTEEAAYTVWKEMATVQNAQDVNTPTWAIAERFLVWAQANVAASTYAQYSRYVASFCSTAAGKMRARDLQPYHVDSWLDGTTWGDSGRRTAVTAVKRCFSWAEEKGWLRVNPLLRVKGPAVKRREQLVGDDDHARMMGVTDGARKPGKRAAKLGIRPKHRAGAFRQVLIALRHSGTRPGMIAAVCVEDVSPAGDAWIIKHHKTEKETGRPLVIRLSPCLQALTKILVADRKTGPLFLNSLGKPWTRNAIRCRMRRLRESLDLPEGTVAYSYRHTWTTNAMVNGVGVATVAELLGHTDLRMISQHYGHLEQQPEHLLKAAAQAMQKKQA